MKLIDVATWRYQLQNVDVASLATDPADLLVIDRARNEDAEFTPMEIARLQAKPSGARRLVLCYWSIGEAEDYRPYWRPEWKRNKPAWLADENPEWKGNYGVRFWDPDWQTILFRDLDRIIAQGFDGVYLDKVDEFEDLGHAPNMQALVCALGDRAHAMHPQFLIVPQNGAALLASEAYRGAIHGIAREDLLFGENGDGNPNDPEDIRASVHWLAKLQADSKPVFVVEYAPVPEHTLSKLASLGFVGLVAHRDLDR